jgi:hypothetical protein
MQNVWKNMHRYKTQRNTNYGRNTNYQNPMHLHIKLEKLFRIKYQVPWLQQQTLVRCFQTLPNCQKPDKLNSITYSIFQNITHISTFISGQTKEHLGVHQPQYTVFSTEPPDIYETCVQCVVWCVFCGMWCLCLCVWCMCMCDICVWYVHSMWHVVYACVMWMWCVCVLLIETLQKLQLV